jgi:hypothetical protein
VLGVGDLAGGEDAGQQFGLAGRRKVARGEIVADRAGRDAARLRYLSDGEPRLLPGQGELAAEVLLAGDPPGIRAFGIR